MTPFTDAAYTAVTGKIHADSRGNYGAPRICAELADDYNIRCGRKRVARLIFHPPLAGSGPGWAAQFGTISSARCRAVR